MDFYDWFLLSEITHAYVICDDPVLLPDDNNKLVPIHFDAIGFKFEKYLDQNIYAPWIVNGRKYEDVPGFQALFPHQNRYLTKYKTARFARVENERIKTLPLIPDHWTEFAEFQDKLGNIVYYRPERLAIAV